MAETAQQLETRLAEVRSAISAALIQSYSVAGRSVTRNLAELRKLEKDLERKLSRIHGSGPIVLTDFSDLDSDLISGRF
jgi:hypothetical protein